MKKIYYGDPKVCDMCTGGFGNTMYDLKTSDGRWANACRSCFKGDNGRLGTGFGQKYKKNGDNRWEKIDG